jgi:hypothetical protein
MFTGVLSAVVDAVASITEAAPAGIVLHILVALGNVVGREPHFYIGETRHGLNEFALIVGQSSRARKGDGKNVALRMLEDADPDWVSSCVASGLSSGEGVIHHVRDAELRIGKNGKLEVVDNGVDDKRLLVVETEFSQPLKMFNREGNILSNVLRDAWDGKGTLRTLTKKAPSRATDAHISLIGHSTPEDLRAHLSDVEIANGLGNRFLIALVNRVQLLPNPGRIPPATLDPIHKRFQRVLAVAKGCGEISRTPEAEEFWTHLYPALTADRPGLVGKLLARAEAHVARLSALYALLAQTRAISMDHLMSALAVWEYCARSVERVFAERTGLDAADRIKAEMLPGQELTLAELREQLFHNHVSAGKLQDALRLLMELKEIRVEERRTAGRPATVVVRLPGNRRMRTYTLRTKGGRGLKCTTPRAKSARSAKRAMSRLR